MELLRKDTISFDLKGTTKNEILHELVDLLDRNELLYDKSEFLEAVLKREKEFSTGIGMGIAIPHGKSSSVKTAGISFGRSTRGVDFESLDGKPATIFFLLAIPENSNASHLKTISELAQKLMKQEIREKVGIIQTYEELVALFQ